ncbi:unnamed protein product [Periconia digitata]|uniref:Uncharacterized protein n=1 Tax=Periconia digitata TaxID=1303443 RepID=A0A9W4UDY6_9PLEO|nr:unnamed protein product [Periconia digitata]
MRQFKKTGYLEEMNMRVSCCSGLITNFRAAYTGERVDHGDFGNCIHNLHSGGCGCDHVLILRQCS